MPEFVRRKRSLEHKFIYPHLCHAITFHPSARGLSPNSVSFHLEVCLTTKEHAQPKYSDHFGLDVPVGS